MRRFGGLKKKGGREKALKLIQTPADNLFLNGEVILKVIYKSRSK